MTVEFTEKKWFPDVKLDEYDARYFMDFPRVYIR